MSDAPAHSTTAVHDSHDVAHEAEHVRKHIRGYLMVFGALLVLTIVTVLASYVDFGTPSMNIVVALIIATIKAGLVAAFFMHLSTEKWTILRFLVVTVIFAFALYALTHLAIDDHIGAAASHPRF